MGMGVSVVTIGDGHSNKTSENDEGLKREQNFLTTFHLKLETHRDLVLTSQPAILLTQNADNLHCNFQSQFTVHLRNLFYLHVVIDLETVDL